MYKLGLTLNKSSTILALLLVILSVWLLEAEANVGDVTLPYSPFQGPLKKRAERSGRQAELLESHQNKKSFPEEKTKVKRRDIDLEELHEDYDGDEGYYEEYYGLRYNTCCTPPGVRPRYCYDCTHHTHPSLTRPPWRGIA